MLRIGSLIQKWNKRSRKQKLLTLANQVHKLCYAIHTKRRFDFDGYITKENLSDDSTAHSATAYQGLSAFYLKVLLREALSAGCDFSQFIDIGSGKGKLCLYAAKYHPFPKIIGIDFSSPLIEIANKNLSKTRHKNIEFLCANAADWRIPDGNSVVFLFNPFDGTILKTFLNTNLDHFRRYDSVLVYTDAKHRPVVEECGFIKLIDSNVYDSYIFHFPHGSTLQ